MFSCHWNHWGVHYCTPAQQRCRCVHSYLGRQRRNSLVKPSKRTPGKPGKLSTKERLKNIIVESLYIFMETFRKISFSLDETLTKPIYIYITITIRCRATLMEQGKETGSRHIQDMVSACLNCWRLGGSMWILDRRFSVASSQVKQLISVQNWASWAP